MVIHMYQQILLQALLVVKGHPGFGSEQLQQHQSTLRPRKDGPRMLASTIFRFFFSLTIDILSAVENEPATDCPLPAAVSCPPLPGHLMSDEEESQLPDAYSKSSFRKGNLIGLTVILVIERRVRAFQHSASKAAKTVVKNHNNNSVLEDEEEAAPSELTASDHISDDKAVDIIASQFATEVSSFPLVY